MTRSDELHDWCVADDVADDPANAYDPPPRDGPGMSDLTDEERIEFHKLRRARRHTGWRGGS